MRIDTNRHPLGRVVTLGTFFAQICAVCLLLGSEAQAQTAERVTLGFATGVMSTNGIDVLYNWHELDFNDTYLAGVLVGYEHPLAYDNFSAGVELQVNHHFGDDFTHNLRCSTTNLP